jgi:hypothetical protein
VPPDATETDDHIPIPPVTNRQTAPTARNSKATARFVAIGYDKTSEKIAAIKLMPGHLQITTANTSALTEIRQSAATPQH